jgi:hypothetical protein
MKARPPMRTAIQIEINILHKIAVAVLDYPGRPQEIVRQVQEVLTII